MLPDVIIIGDSHCNALKAGCDAHGIRADMLRFSGNFWHAGHILYHAQHGVWVRGLPAMQAQILALREAWGGRSLVNREVPIIAAMGYHLGRMVPPFGFNRHVTDADAFAADAESLYASASLLDAYVDDLRANHIRMAQRMARNAEMVLVVPPRLFPGTSYDRFSDAISRRMLAVGVRLFDPAPDLFPDGLSAHLIAEDGVHGNDLYGMQVIGAMVAAGLFAKRAA